MEKTPWIWGILDFRSISVSAFCIRRKMTMLLNLPKIHFDFGAVSALDAELNRLGIGRPLITTDRNLVACGVLDKVMSSLPRDCGFPIFDETPENPTVDGVEKAYERYILEECDGVVAVGGGSVIDTSKVVALRAGHEGPISQYANKPEKITDTTAPIISIPTTAGTGSEITFGAGIHPDSSTPAMNIGSPTLVPKVAICDPDLTMTLPPSLTAGTGMDALGQCVEAYLATGNNPPIDAVVLDGAQRSLAYIERAVENGSDRDARWHMMMAALEGGIGIHKGLGSVHAIANTLGDQGYNHGILVSVALPAVLRFVEEDVSDKMTALATKAFGLNATSQIPTAIEQLNMRIGLPTTLRELGYRVRDLDRAAELCVGSKFNESAPRVPTQDQYKMIISNMMG
jgi:alcohol dehydrogenase class IV